MMRHPAIATVCLAACLFGVAATALAEGEGQADLDKATEMKLTATSMNDLEMVVRLCEEALEKGLDEDNAKFANELLTSTLYQHAEMICRAIFDRRPPSPRWPLLRQFAMRDLDKALARNENHGEVHLLVARLQALPEGDADRARTSADAAVKLLEGPKRKAAALVVRAEMIDDADQRLDDLNEAIKLDPTNADAWRLRGVAHLAEGDEEKALEDFESLLKTQPDNLAMLRLAGGVLADLENFDRALELHNRAIELAPDDAATYLSRSRIYALMDEDQKALADLDLAIKLEPQDIAALLMRAQIRLTVDELDSALADADRALQLRPGLPPAMLLRSSILAAKERYDDAIAEIEKLLRDNPDDVGLRLQLGTYELGGDRPRKAIEIFGEVLADEPDNWIALRTRGDAYLAVGKHAEAIADYEQAIKIEPENGGLLNNLAWVLATSPTDELRDGKRSIELGTKACEATEFKEAHILSTLAAGYAEAGDFEAAMKWAAKAVETGDDEHQEQLEQELESYKQKKPWRELQQIEERPEPVQPGPDDLQI